MTNISPALFSPLPFHGEIMKTCILQKKSDVPETIFITFKKQVNLDLKA